MTDDDRPDDDHPDDDRSADDSDAVADNRGDIIASMPVREQIRLLSGRTMWAVRGIPGSDLEEIRVADGPHGLRCQDEPDGGGDHVGMAPSLPATCFPTAVTLGATWDPALLEKVGAALATEAIDQGVSVVLGPGLNLKRHPAGGRNFEYYSEDPLLSGRLAAAIVRGLQGGGVGACVKHFAANNHESFRFVADAVVDPRTLREVYLRGFEIAVTESAPWTVMCAYNQLNGRYCSEDRWLLTELLRDEWGFDGLVMSDWGATNDRALGIAAGLDLQMPGCRGAFDGEILDAVDAGTLAPEEVAQAARRVAQLIARAQTARPRGGGFNARNSAWVEEHHELARRVAAAGTVLLSNDGVLPIAEPASVAVIGGFATAPRYQGAGSSLVNSTRVDTVLDAARDRFGNPRVRFEQAVDPVTGALLPGGRDRAVRAASAADVAVLVVGLPAADESEGFDRSHLAMPTGTTELVEAVCAAQPRTVVVLCNGAPVEMSWADRPAAVLEAYLGGQAGGSAIVDVLSGDAEPGGRLAESIPVDMSDLAASGTFPGEPRRTEYREQQMVGYRFHTTCEVSARFAFGHGLSYTTWKVGEPRLTTSDDGAGGTAVPSGVEVAVTNTGKRAGSHVVQIYLDPVDTAAERPATVLAGWAKVHLDGGGSETVSIALDRRSMEVFDVEEGSWRLDPGRYLLRVANSVLDTEHTVELRVDGDAPSDPWGCRGLAADRRVVSAAPPPDRPFHRNSTVDDLTTTPIGPLIRRIVIGTARRSVRAELSDPGPALMRMYEQSALEMPLRALVALAGGGLRLSHIDGLIDLLNRRYGLLGRRAARAASSAAARARSLVAGRTDR